MTWPNLLLVMFGSGIGALSRQVLGDVISRFSSTRFPWNTWVINLLGTIALGITLRNAVAHHSMVEWWLFWSSFCGAFTTFSTLSVETVWLLKKHIGLAILYISSSVLAGVIVIWMIEHL